MKRDLLKDDFLGYTFKGVFIKYRTGSMDINYIASASKKLEQGMNKTKHIIHKCTDNKLLNI